jgi:hypothetical protein
LQFSVIAKGWDKHLNKQCHLKGKKNSRDFIVLGIITVEIHYEITAA